MYNAEWRLLKKQKRKPQKKRLQAMKKARPDLDIYYDVEALRRDGGLKQKLLT